MQNLIALWSSFDARRRIVIIGATLAVFLAVIGLARMAGTPGMGLLYAGLDGAAAGEVVAALDQRGVTYEVRGDSIYVDATQRDSLRMTLAADGLPAAGVAGYELLDGLSGFGTTSQMFDAAYWRAKEGELARTILANPQIKSARVHIAQAPSQVFRRDQRPTASVTVSTTQGNLPMGQADALKHLVAAAVSGMMPEDVAVIDTVGGLIESSSDTTLPDGNAQNRAAEIRANVERLLIARVGANRAVVEVALDLVTDSETVTERRFDPQGKVAISSETQEKTGSSTEPGGAVTVASNLPQGDTSAGGNGKSQTSETSERLNFEVSETTREVQRVPGSIRKLSVAVLVDGQQVVGADGNTTWTARTDEELATLRELVASAVGLDETRGDVQTLKSLAFEPVPDLGTSADSSLLSAFGPINIMTAIQIAALALVALILGLFVVRPILSAQARIVPALGLQPGPLALPGIARAQSEALSGEIDDGSGLPHFKVNTFDAPATLNNEPVARLRRLIEERQAESVEILRSWMEVDEEKV
ncbi:MAG: flagellar M-ring protein FliF [Rhodoferax sp.]|nr:flagellar M-ring protein FliF [Pseudorhodobacter sp.]